MVNVSKLRAKSVSSFVGDLKAQGSRDNYFSVLKGYFEFIKPELKSVPDKIEGKLNVDKIQAVDEVSVEYVTDPEVKVMTGDIDYEEDLRRYRDEVLASHAGSTRKFKFRVLFRYFKVNQIEFEEGFMKNMLGAGKPVTAIVEKVPNHNQLDKLIDRINPAGRTEIVLMAKAGLRPEEVLIAQMKNLDLDYVAEYVDSETGKEMSVPIGKLNIPVAKGEQPRYAFLIKEVTDELRGWLKRRPKYIKDLKNRGHYTKTEAEVNEDQIFPYGEKTLRSFWETTLNKCDMAQQEDLTLRNRFIYRLHNLRKFFRTHGNWSNTDVAEAQMGHQEGMNKIYARTGGSIELMVKGIRQAEPHLTSRKLRVHDIEGVMAQNERLKMEMAELMGVLDSLKERVENLEEIGALPEEKEALKKGMKE